MLTGYGGINMKQLNAIMAQIETQRQLSQKEMGALEAKAFAAFRKAMKKKMPQIDAMVALLEQSMELTQVENDEYFHSFVRFDFDSLIDTKQPYQKELLAQLLSEDHCLDADFQNDCVTNSIGPCLLINHEGDVLDQDSGKWVISKRDYETKEELFSQIEAHMEKTGYFPSVIRCDYYGNARYVNTQSAEQVEANKALAMANDILSKATTVQQGE